MNIHTREQSLQNNVHHASEGRVSQIAEDRDRKRFESVFDGKKPIADNAPKEKDADDHYGQIDEVEAVVEWAQQLLLKNSLTPKAGDALQNGATLLSGAANNLRPEEMISRALAQSNVNISFPCCEGLDVSLTKDQYGAVSIVFQTTNPALSETLQRELSNLKQELRRKFSLFDLSVKIEFRDENRNRDLEQD